MAAKDIFKLSWKTFFNPAAWLDFNFIKQFNQFLFRSMRDLRTIEQPERSETFEQAMARQGVNEEDIKHLYEEYSAYALFFVLFSVLIIIFAFYLLFFHYSIYGWVIALTAALISAVQAFRYDFWAFQIKQRKLGYTFKEWRTQRFRKGK